MKKLILLIVVALSISGARAQWTTNGPYGGQIIAMAVSGTSIFATTPYGGVYRSSNNGVSWARANNGLPNDYVVSSLAVSGSNIFAGTGGFYGGPYGKGVFLSTDNGSTWTQAGLANLGILSIAVIGSDIFASTTDSGVYLSSSNGNSWRALNTGVGITTGGYFPEWLAANGSEIYLYFHNGVYGSTDNGTTWTQLTNGLTDTRVVAMAFSGSTIYAGTGDGGVFRSTDNGNSWTAVDTGLPPTTTGYYPVTSLFANDSAIYVSVFDFNSDSTTLNGIYISTDNGDSWTQINTGLTCTYINSLVAVGSDIFAGTIAGGVFLTTNKGAGWSAVNNNIINTEITSMAVSGSTIYAGTKVDGVFLSTDNGANWKAVDSNIVNYSISSLAINGSNIIASTYDGMFVSNNNGTSWAMADSGLTSEVSALAISGTNIIAGGAYGQVFLSADDGKHWTFVDSILPSGYYNAIQALAVSGSNIFAGTGDGGPDGNGVFLSANNGNTWTAVNNGLPVNTDVKALAINGSNIYAGTHSGLFLSTNNGTSWSSLNTGLPDTNITCLAVKGQNIFVGTYSDAFLSINGGHSWSSLGYPNTYISSIVYNSTTLFVSTYGIGVWQQALSSLICIPTSDTLTASICPGASYLFKGKHLTITGFYADTLTATTGCDSIVVLHLQFTNANAAVTPSGPVTLCNGDSVVLDAGAGFSSYYWSNHATTRNITIKQTGNYTCRTTLSGCLGNSNSVHVTSVAVKAGFTETIKHDTVSFTNSSTGAFSYLWNFGNGVTTTSNSPTYIYPTSGSHTVILTATNGTCTAADTQVIQTSCYKPTLSAISGPTDVCADSVKTYTVQANPAANSFTWLTLGSLSVLSELGTDSLTVRFNSNFEDGTIRVIGTGCGGSSNVQSIYIALNCVKDGNVNTPGNGVPDESPTNILIFPNPFNEQFEVQFETTENQTARIKVYTIQGQLLHDITQPTVTGTNQLYIDMNTAASGIYLVNILVGEEMKVVKVVKE